MLIPSNQRILLAGASGYIGRAAASELSRRGHHVVALVRPASKAAAARLQGLTEVRLADVTDPASLQGAGITGEHFDNVVSCLASRTGVGSDAWHVDYHANINLLSTARECQASHFVLLSAICVQNPQLEFQRAKLAFEASLAASGLGYSIVRPTAFFKSLAGQIPRLKAGKPFVLFGNGPGPASRPISERDLARFLADCVEHPAEHAGVLPVGGPGPAITPLERGEILFELLGRRPRFRRLPLALFDSIAMPLAALSRVLPALAAKAELARIGRYYATEPMLLRHPVTGHYDGDGTPVYGEDFLDVFYRHAIEHGLEGQELGDQALF